MASITDNIKKVEEAMKDPAKKEGLGLLLKNKAIDAMAGGIGSEPWEIYMSMFADNQAQLDRLTVAKANEPAWLKEARAYSMANAVCAPNTNTKTGNGIFDSPLISVEIDKGLGTNTEVGVQNLRPPDFKNFIP